MEEHRDGGTWEWGKRPGMGEHGDGEALGWRNIGMEKHRDQGTSGWGNIGMERMLWDGETSGWRNMGMRKTLWDGGTWGWMKAQGCRNALGWGNVGMDEGSGIQERSAPVFHPFPKESGPARRKGRARAATQRCPAGTPGQGHRGHPRGDTRTGTPGQGHPITDPSPDPLISLQPLHPQGSPPGISPPAPHSQGIPSQGSPPSPSGCRDPLLQDPISALLSTGILLQALCPQKSPFRNPPRTSPSAGIPAQGSSFQPLCPQGSLLRVSCSKSPFSPFHILQLPLGSSSNPSILSDFPSSPSGFFLQPPESPQGTAPRSPLPSLTFPFSSVCLSPVNPFFSPLQ